MTPGSEAEAGKGSEWLQPPEIANLGPLVQAAKGELLDTHGAELEGPTRGQAPGEDRPTYPDPVWAE